ncbi:hypothetical protein BC833DRAFT_563896 [Globomyces pollinis-pini]|nr:hypothetical protein BC833DRAFT_563896 [Globomyces pollinis-pini]KAJ2995857.1 hypothetical protein HDV02_000374 [Globomyces sp. JEL0801]
MLGEENNEPSPFLIHKGHAKIQRGINPIPLRKFMALCTPATVKDIQALYEFLFVEDTTVPTPMNERSIPILGNISYSAVNATPFLIVLDAEYSSEKPTFIHLDKLKSIKDEVDLKAACTMSLHFDDHDVKLIFATSTDYQDWLQAFQMATSMTRSLADVTFGNAEVNDFQQYLSGTGSRASRTSSFSPTRSRTSFSPSRNSYGVNPLSASQSLGRPRNSLDSQRLPIPPRSFTESMIEKSDMVPPASTTEVTNPEENNSTASSF